MASSSYARMPNTSSNANAATSTSSYQAAPMCVISSLDDIISYIEISTIFPENFNNSDIIDIAITDNLASGRQLELLDTIGSVSGIHMSLLMDHFATKGFIPIGYQQRHGGYRIIRFIRHCNKNNHPQQTHHQQRQQQVSTVSATAPPPPPPVVAAAAQQAQLQAQLQSPQPIFFQQSFQPSRAGGNEANPFYR